MNAYELAKQLEERHAPYEDDAANMLRQQADRIAELEKQGEPVAWMQMHHKDNVPTKFSPVKVWEDDIPLYTTPQIKPLSDEEITKIRQATKAKSTENWADTLAFARAIEERHGIK